MNHHRQPRRIAAPAKITESKTRDENPKAPEPIVLGMNHPPQYRRQHNGSDRTKERLRPATKHEAAEDKLLHNWHRNAAADQQDQKSVGVLAAYIRVRRSLSRADKRYGQGLGQQ